MNIIPPLFLGLVQGLTEFIPVSSSAHLYVLPKIFDFTQFLSSTSFILFLHFGTLLALLVYYRNLIWSYIKTSMKFLSKKNLETTEKRDIKIVRNIIIATIPAGIIGALADKVLSNFYDSQVTDKFLAFLLVAVPMILVGSFFIFESRIIKNNKNTNENLTIKQSFIIGISQCFAFIRGVSRSGMTLISGELEGLSRYSAAEFSFLISIPIIAGSSLLEIYNFFKANDFSQDQLLEYTIGMIASFVFGLIAIKFLLDFLKKRDLKVFGYYRVLFGLFLVFLIIFR